LIVATSRVYRGMHNVSDVVCGLLIGFGCILVGYVAVRAGLAAAHEHASAQAPGARPVDDRGLPLVQGVAR
jgi:membrane-associated phospholipid phosphatase